MPSSIAAKQWNRQEYGGIDSQENGALPLISEVPTRPVLANADFIARASWEGTLRYAVQRCGRDDFEVAIEMAISQSYMSKVLKGVAGLYGERLVKFMRITGSVAPLQWMAEQVGYELKKKEPLSEVELLRRRVAELERDQRRQA